MSAHWRDPDHWTTLLPLRCRVRSPFTRNTGRVTAIDPGRRVLVLWDAEPRRDTYEAWTSHPGDLERVS